MGRSMSKTIKAITHLTKNVFQFERDFPVEFASLRVLLERVGGSHGLADDERFRSELGDIIYSNRRRSPEEKHRRDAEQLADDLKDLIENLGAALGKLSGLDGHYSSRI